MSLLSLPFELKRMIALNIEEDEDICNFRAACTFTRDIIDGDEGSFWRARFRDTYDVLNNLQSSTKWQRSEINNTMRDEYMHRSQLSDAFVSGTALDCQLDSFTGLLELLIIESYDGVADTTAGQSKNLRQLSRIWSRGGTLHSSANVNECPLAEVALAHLEFSRDGISKRFADEQSQYYRQLACYAASYHETIFDADDGKHPDAINWEWLWDNIGFWANHMHNEGDGQLYNVMRGLEAAEWPRAWRRRLTKAPTPLGRRWVGTYAYLNLKDLYNLRDDMEGACIDHTSCDDGHEGLLRLELTMPKEETEQHWPASWEEELCSLSCRNREAMELKLRATDPDCSPIYFQMHESSNGSASAASTGHGWLNPLRAQNEIPGWQRFTMMRDTFDADNRNLWAYEGIVLPGSQIIVGRWWYPRFMSEPESEEMSGPFVFWNIDP